MRVHKHTRTASEMCLWQFCFGAKSKCSTLIMKFSLKLKGQHSLLPELHPVHKCHWKRAIQPKGFKKSTVELTLTAGPPEDAGFDTRHLTVLSTQSHARSRCIVLPVVRVQLKRVGPRPLCSLGLVHTSTCKKQTNTEARKTICHRRSYRKRKGEKKSAFLHMFLCNLIPP